MFLNINFLLDLLKSCLPTISRKNKASPYPREKQVSTKAKDSFISTLSIPTSSSLRQHLQLLPLELYGEILRLTLVPPQGEIHTIIPSYLPPIALQFNRSLRGSFSATYYANSSILLIENTTSGAIVFSKWIDSLPKAALELLCKDYGTNDQDILDNAVDIHMGISEGRRVRVHCEMRDEKYVRVLRVRVFGEDW